MILLAGRHLSNGLGDSQNGREWCPELDNEQPCKCTEFREEAITNFSPAHLGSLSARLGFFLVCLETLLLHLGPSYFVWGPSQSNCWVPSYSDSKKIHKTLTKCPKYIYFRPLTYGLVWTWEKTTFKPYLLIILLNPLNITGKIQSDNNALVTSVPLLFLCI